MRRTIWFWLYFIVAVIMAIYFSSRIIMVGMGRGDAARVRSISISADIPGKDLTQLAAAAAVAPGTRAYSIDLDQMRNRLMAVPGVRGVAVRRMPNGNLSVHAKLHRAVAAWTDGQSYYPVSTDGTIVRRPSDTRDAGVVLFRGPLPDDISQITKIAQNLIQDLDYLEWIEGRRWNLVTNGGITVMLPEGDPNSAIGSLLVLDKNHKILDRDIKIIDMRDDARILIK